MPINSVEFHTAITFPDTHRFHASKQLIVGIENKYAGRDMWQQHVRQGACATTDAVLQVQGRGILLQGVPGLRLPRQGHAMRTDGEASPCCQLSHTHTSTRAPTADCSVEGGA